MDINCLELHEKIICRACLSQSGDMKSMTENDESLSNMFAFVTHLEISSLDTLSSYICSHCEEKLNISYNFQKQCHKSNEVLLKCLEASTVVTFKDESINQNEVIEFIKEGDNFEKNSDDLDYKPRSKTNKKDVRQTMRLVQFSYDRVSQAIEECKRTFFENTECIRCGFIGSNMRALSVHMSHIHKDIKDRWCVKCNKEFDNLTNHLENHDTDDLKCQFCGKSFQAKGHLTEHLRSHCEIRPYKCESCEKCFISQRHLNIHFRIHLNERPFKCHLCVKSFIQSHSLKIHMKQHEKQLKYVCNGCNTNFKDKQSVSDHACAVNENTNEIDSNIETNNICATPQNFCVECNKRVRSLERHKQQSHSTNSNGCNEYGDNILENKLCTVCGKQFKSASKLRLHMRIHTGEAPYKCSFCDKRVTTRNQLVVHERIHTGERPHVCHVCGKGFAQSSVLNTHMRLHTGRPEVCKICNQRFCRPAELRLHMRKHTGEKPYLCTECGQAFIQKSHLVEHNKTHSDARPYQCSYCEKSFKQGSSLKSHVHIHLGFKPFECNQCSYACRQSYRLTQHMKQHASDTPRQDRPHVCPVCNKSYTTQAMLASHVKSTHNVNSQFYD